MYFIYIYIWHPEELEYNCRWPAWALLPQCALSCTHYSGATRESLLAASSEARNLYVHNVYIHIEHVYMVYIETPLGYYISTYVESANCL